MISSFEHTQERYLCISHEKKTNDGARLDPAKTINLTYDEFDNLRTYASEISDILNREEEEEGEGDIEIDDDTLTVYASCLKEDQDREPLVSIFTYSNASRGHQHMSNLTPDEREKYVLKELKIPRPDKEAVANIVIGEEVAKIAEHHGEDPFPSTYDYLDEEKTSDLITRVLKELNYIEPLNVGGLMKGFVHFGGPQNLFNVEECKRKDFAAHPQQYKAIMEAYNHVLST